MNFEDLAGVVFKGTEAVIHEAKENMILGATSENQSIVNKIVPKIPVFVLDLENFTLSSGFEAASKGRRNISPSAWKILANSTERVTSRQCQYPLHSPLPAQVRIRCAYEFAALEEAEYKPVLLSVFSEDEINDPKKVLQLNTEQTQALLNIHTNSLSVPHYSDGENGKDLYQVLLSPQSENIVDTENESDYESTYSNSHNLSLSTTSTEYGNWSSSDTESNYATGRVSMVAIHVDESNADEIGSRNSACSSSEEYFAKVSKWDKDNSIIDVGLSRSGTEQNVSECISLTTKAINQFVESVNNSMKPQLSNSYDHDKYLHACERSKAKYSGNDAITVWSNLQNIVASIYGNAEVQIYGSFATGLWLPGHSDLDFVITFQRVVFPSPPAPVMIPTYLMYLQYFNQQPMVVPMSPNDGRSSQWVNFNQYGPQCLKTHALPRPLTPPGTRSFNETKPFQLKHAISSLSAATQTENSVHPGQGDADHINDPSIAAPCFPQNSSLLQTDNIFSDSRKQHFAPPMAIMQTVPGMPMLPPTMEIVQMDRGQQICYLSALYSALRYQPWCKSIELIRGSMPVIKMIAAGASPTKNETLSDHGVSPNSSTSAIPVDISFHTGDHRGIQARDYVLQLIECLPGVLRPLVLVLKWVIRDCDLNNVYKGGIGSYSLTLLVSFFLLRCGYFIVPRNISASSSNDAGTRNPRHHAVPQYKTDGTPLNSVPFCNRPSRSKSFPSFSAMAAAVQPCSGFYAPCGDLSTQSSSSLNAHYDESKCYDTCAANEINQCESAGSNCENRKTRLPMVEPDDIPPLFTQKYLASLNTTGRNKLQKAQRIVEEVTLDSRIWLKKFIAARSCRTNIKGDHFEIGVFLFGILKLYSHPMQGGMDLSSVGIDISDRGSLFVPGLPSALCIRDPVADTNMVGGNSFNVNKVQAKFSELHERMICEPSTICTLLNRFNRSRKDGNYCGSGCSDEIGTDETGENNIVSRLSSKTLNNSMNRQQQSQSIGAAPLFQGQVMQGQTGYPSFYSRLPLPVISQNVPLRPVEGGFSNFNSDGMLMPPHYFEKP